MTTKDIRTLTYKELKEHLKNNGFKAFRAKQIDEWLWNKGITDYEQMHTVPKDLRAYLSANFPLHPLQLSEKQISQDQTIKCRFTTHDGHAIEGVLIPEGKRVTACISSQIGCSLDCKFCATGKLKLARNLEAHEIYEQAFRLNQLAGEHYDLKLTNIVYMGMGEPLLNFKNVVKSISKITDENGMGMSPRRITVSTVGIAKMIKKLADENLRVNFALSLHSAIPEKRAAIMSITESNTLEDLKEAVRYFHEQTGVRVTYEYTLLKGVNDTLDDAKALAEFCKISPCKINLIEYNEVAQTSFQKSSKKNTKTFDDFLLSKNLIVNYRRSRGDDIDAACGQLANK